MLAAGYRLRQRCSHDSSSWLIFLRSANDLCDQRCVEYKHRRCEGCTGTSKKCSSISSPQGIAISLPGRALLVLTNRLREAWGVSIGWLLFISKSGCCCQPPPSAFEMCAHCQTWTGTIPCETAPRFEGQSTRVAKFDPFTIAACSP